MEIVKSQLKFFILSIPDFWANNHSYVNDKKNI